MGWSLPVLKELATSDQQKRLRPVNAIKEGIINIFNTSVHRNTREKLSVLELGERTSPWNVVVSPHA